MCECIAGYTDANCSTNINECDPDPCVNGTCSDLVDGFSCDCDNGFTGETCDTILSECLLSNPCANGGTCMDIPDGYRCICPSSYTGESCEIEIIDACDSSPCKNNGTCMSFLNETFSCECVTGYEGNTCENDTNECTTFPCMNNGICVESSTTLTSLQEMFGNISNNFVIPDVEIGEFSCLCQDGYDGDVCEIITVCEELDPCVNGGTCTLDDFGEKICQCPQGYAGDFCQTDINECLAQPCQNEGICLESNTTIPDDSISLSLPDAGEFLCICQIGFIGPTCSFPDPCIVSPCANNGTCIANENDGTFVCECTADFKGTNCSVNISTTACYGNPCMNNGSCIDNSITQQELFGLGLNISLSNLPPLTDDAFFCVCLLQFSGDFCEDMVDPCELTTCSNGGTCMTDGEVATCMCPNGTTGSSCETDVNECNPDPCVNDGMCVESGNSEENIPVPLPDFGDYTCVCQPQYTGKNCEDMIEDPCSPNPCVNGTCETTDGSDYFCNCTVGFNGTNCDVNIDDCIDNYCVNGTCVDLINGYECDCVPGYTDSNCSTNINDCEPNPCVNGNCIDLVDGYMCECIAGYTDANCSTNINDCDPDPCVNGTCNDLVDGFNCDCTSGFTGSLCESDINECSSTPYPCLSYLVCVESGSTIQSLQEMFSEITESFPIPKIDIGEFTCLCLNGSSADLCPITDLCLELDPCENGGSCAVNENLTITCMCPNGYDGDTCQIDVNECADSQCLNNGFCIESGTIVDNIPVNITIPQVDAGEFVCLCPPAYTGKLCETPLTSSCIEFDPCLNGGTCVFNEITNIKYCECPTTYEGTNCESNVDECEKGIHLCNLAGSDCVDLPGTYKCECFNGFSGDYCNQTIVTECVPQCINGGECNDGVCECTTTGYEGIDCSIDINECEQNEMICNNGTCSNTDGSHECNCHTDYTGPDCLTVINSVTDNEPSFPIGIVIGVALVVLGVLVLVLMLVVVVVVVYKRRYNKRHDSYSPAAVENKDRPLPPRIEKEVLI